MIPKRAWIALLLLLAIFMIGQKTFAQNQYKIVEIEVEGNKVASKSLILGVSSLNLGSPLTPAASSETIRRLYGLNIFSDIRLEVEDVSGGIKVWIVVKELPKLSGLEFIGNDKIDDKDLKNELGLGVGGYISPYLIETKEYEIKDKYAEEGYFQATVTPEVEYNADSTEAILRYKIDEKSKVKVEKVVVTGNVRVPAEDVVGKMRNRKRGFLKSSDFAQDKYEEDKEKVIAEFHKKGFIDAYLKSDSMTIDSVRNRMTIYLDVYEGPLYYFGKTEFTNNKELPSKYLNRKLKYSEGDVFNLEDYNRSMEELYSAYYDIGHLHIRILDERTTRADSIIDISMDVAEGLPSHINLVKIVGNHKTKDKVIRRELSALPGSKFNRALLIRSVRDVMALNYFSNVNPVPLNLPNGDVDLEFEVEEKQTGQVSAGAAFNSEDKLVGNFGMGIPNFRGMGQNLSFNMEFGSRTSSFSISFSEPWLFGRPTLFSGSVYSTRRKWYSDYTETRQGFSVRFGKRLKWPDNYFRAYASYRLERDKYEDFDDDFIISNSEKDYHYYYALRPDDSIIVSGTDTSYVWHENDQIWLYTDSTKTDSTEALSLYYHLGNYYNGSILEFEDQWKTASRISLTITRDSRNLPEFATSGTDFSYTIEKTGGFLGGYWDYTKHSVSFAKFIPLFWKVALAARVEFGAINSSAVDVNNNRTDKTTLLSDRFTPGGTAYDGVIRGYDDGSITPDTAIIFDYEEYYYFNRDSIIEAGSGYYTDPNHSNADSTYSEVDTTYTRVRGNYMFITNLEIQIPIVEQTIYGLLFFDAGNSWLDLKDVRPFVNGGLYKSVGLGFRVAVPGIGTIGFDFGYNLDEFGKSTNEAFSSRYQERGWNSHFQIGTTFR